MSNKIGFIIQLSGSSLLNRSDSESRSSLKCSEKQLNGSAFREVLRLNQIQTSSDIPLKQQSHYHKTALPTESESK